MIDWMIDCYERTYKTYLRDDYDIAAMIMSTTIMRHECKDYNLLKEDSVRL